MINKFESIGIALCIGIMTAALFLLGMNNTKDGNDTFTSEKEQIENNLAATKPVQASDTAALESVIKDSMSINGEIQKLVVTDVSEGIGEPVKEGDTVTVNYIGTLQSGAEFDNSYKRGAPFSFTVGEGRVIKGWEQGLIGMKVNGQRTLVIPADLAYGNQVVGPIPANSTLLFTIELLKIE